ncbi:hypothetical protein GJ744_001012 [Endocarpon pusillum]|uniref:DUF7580 domain-containing protein n=1 Tax=Endocarpon pusillum TaxID=364733 RepID=A0A8H7AD58_9EURO|nr:hypothetical protein GJ744_001012 [Endocarpon pusillum]
MAELAGLALGGLPIVLWSLEKYHDPVRSCWRYDETLSSLRDNIFIQQEQLFKTMKNIGLHEPSLEDLEEYLRIQHPNKCTEYISIVGHMGDIIKKLMEKLDIDIKGKPQWTNDPPDRAAWEWRKVKRAFGTKERKSLISDLQYWNDALKNCFEKQEVPLDDTDPIVQKIQSTFNPKRCELLRENAQAIHRALRSAWTCGCIPPHRGSIELDWHSDEPMMPFAPPTFSVAFSFTKAQHCQHNPSEEFWQNVQVEVEELKPPSTADAIAAPANPVQAGNNTFRGRSSKILRFSHLFRPSPATSTSRTPQPAAPTGTPPVSLAPSSIHCLCGVIQKAHLGTFAPGFLHDPDPSRTRRVIITNHPKRISSSAKSLPLKTFLSSQPLPSHLALSRKQRFGIAAAMAWAVLHLGGSPWLSDTWNRDDVHLFLESNSTGRELLAHNPCVSGLFSSKSASSVPASSTAPTSFQGAQIRNKAIFALGIFLIELCLPCSFEQLREQHTGNTQAAAISDYEIALAKIDNVYLDAGYSYGYAVQRCLRLEFPGRDIEKNFDFRQFRQSFYTHVVAPIQAYYTRLPGLPQAV